MAFFMAYKGWFTIHLQVPGMIPEVPAIPAKWSTWRVRVSHQKKKPSDFPLYMVCLLEILVGYSNPLYPYRQQIIRVFFSLLMWNV